MLDSNVVKSSCAYHELRSIHLQPGQYSISTLGEAHKGSTALACTRPYFVIAGKDVMWIAAISKKTANTNSRMLQCSVVAFDWEYSKFGYRVRRSYYDVF